jgi:hypothetical protein
VSLSFKGKPEDAHHVGQHLVVIPEAQRLLGGFGEAEVDGAREELPPAVDAPRRQQLLRADETEEIADLRPDQVLSAVAARHREVARVGQATLAEIRDQPGVLVVRVGGDVERPRQHAQLLERELDLGGIRARRRLRQRRPRPGPQRHPRHQRRHSHPPHAPSRTCR